MQNGGQAVSPLQLFNREVGVSINANFAGDSHGFHRELFRRQLRVLCKCARGGDCVAFIAGNPDGHHLVNRSPRPAKLLEIGNADPADRCLYPDIDLGLEASGPGFTHRDGSLYPAKPR